MIIHFIKDWFNHHFTFNLKTRTAGLVSTIDIDFPWYRKNLKFPYYLTKNKLGEEVDPYDTYVEIIAAHKSIQSRPTFFILTNGNSAYEKIRRYDYAAYRALIKKLSTDADIGIHPPYQAAIDARAMSVATDFFISMSGIQASLSRQHYLRLKLPTTYRLLIKEGITRDFTLGYADRVGFRAGTARSFFWYDLLNEKVTDLKLTPLVAMDVTLKNYMGLSATNGLAKLMQLKNTIDQYGGNMTLLWHNSSLSELDDWTAYRETYFQFLASYQE